MVSGTPKYPISLGRRPEAVGPSCDISTLRENLFFPEKKNDKEYAQSQRQRALERSIRRAKRELGLMQKTGSRRI